MNGFQSGRNAWSRNGSRFGQIGEAWGVSVPRTRSGVDHWWNKWRWMELTRLGRSAVEALGALGVTLVANDDVGT